MIEQPALRLRGGGANLKRKDARKRKFSESQLYTSSHQSLKASAQSPRDNTEDAKRQKTRVSSPPHDAHTEGMASLDVMDMDTEKSKRFICFVGNLPFSANTDSITRHFAILQPRSVRHRTVKDTGKSKGFAFLEFDGYDRMKTCLQLYHHSSFDDGISPPRKINIELTAGGGGAKSKDRRSKLSIKNEKLNEQRRRRALTKDKQALTSTQTAETNPDPGSDSIHPSRRRRMPGL